MNEIIDKLQQLEIPRREAEVYVALLQKKEFTAPEIAKITSVSRTKSYEILQNLTKKGLSNESYRNGVKVFSAVNPKNVFENILCNYDEKRKLVNQLNEYLCKLYSDRDSIIAPLDYIEIINDVEQIRERFLNIQKNTKRELIGFTKPPYSLPKMTDNIENQSPIQSRNVKVRSIYEFDSITTIKEQNDLIEGVKKFQSLGEEAKVIKKLPMKLLISDETITMFALNDRVSLKPSITTMIVDHPSFAKAQKEVFKAYWAKAISIEKFKKLKFI